MNTKYTQKIALFATVSQFAMLVCGGANAADMPLRAPALKAAAVPAYSWTGCFAGGQLGWGWAHHDVTASNFSFGPGSTPIAATNALETSSGVYGGQLGCNYQFLGNWVVGIQGDIAGTSIKGSVADPLQRLDPSFIDSGTIGVKTDWLASVTGRLGFTAWDNRALFYAKGGAAWEHSQWDFSRSTYCNSFHCPGSTEVGDGRTGWTAGAGAEWVISPSWSNWTAFAEYNYYDFGNGPVFTTPTTDPRNTTALGRQQIQTVKFGVNYKLFSP
jgi:outer membrane immunogenic protein